MFFVEFLIFQLSRQNTMLDYQVFKVLMEAIRAHMLWVLP